MRFTRVYTEVFNMTDHSLLCTETNNLCFDDLEARDDQDPRIDCENVVGNESEALICAVPLQRDEDFVFVFESKVNFCPEVIFSTDRSGELDLCVRKEALDWIYKAHAHYNFGALSVCLAVNYLDRFLSLYELPSGKKWTVQLLAVACLSLAAKMEEVNVPLTVDLQVADPKFVFEAKTIKRMELLVLSTLKWRMQACTPCSFIDYFLRKINNADALPSGSLIDRSIQFILKTMKGIDFLEFRPSEISAAVAICVTREAQTLDINKAMSNIIPVEKDRVFKCIEMIQDLTLVTETSNVASGRTRAQVPQSPVGVLDAACLSYKSDERTVGSCPNSSLHTETSPHTKRRKLIEIMKCGFYSITQFQIFSEWEFWCGCLCKRPPL
uniref:Cyclin D2 n=1 Tax=Daucus carota TaxID=4039 RepID=Q8L6U0_DAUCA|nr:cyclin D2 [Daucus carota]